MKRLFREGAWFSEKLVLISFGLSAIFSIYSIITNVLIEDALFIRLLLVATIYSIILVALYLRVFLTNHSGLSQSIKNNGKNPGVVITAIIIVLPLLHIPAISKGMPAAIHHLISENAEQVVTVEKTFSSEYCGRGAYIQEYQYLFNNEICGIANEDWELLRNGSRVLLVGRKSFLGFSYDKYSVSMN